MYPHPVSYIPLFITRSGIPLNEFHGDEGEVLDSGAFTFSEIKDMDISSRKIVNAALQFALAKVAE